MLFIQAFRYAADPFYFGRLGKEGSNSVYASLMTYFIIIVCTIFLMVTLFLDVFKYFIPNEAYWAGLSIVPILLLANIFQGVYYNLSFWYKFIDKTHYGAYMALVGASITLVLNGLFIPLYGYKACAWVTFTAYGSIMLLSYFIGQRHYPIPYELKRIAFYVLLAVGMFLIHTSLKAILPFSPLYLSGVLFIGYLMTIVLLEWKRVLALRMGG